jgi:hypothetical protein
VSNGFPTSFKRLGERTRVLRNRGVAVKLLASPKIKNERVIVKRILMAMLLVSLVGIGGARADDSGTLVWCGLDYSKVQMIGTQDFREPDQIFPGMLEEWNGLFMTEMIPKLEKMAGSLASDLDAVTAKNGKASASQIKHEDGTRDEMVMPTDITEETIAKMVRGYDLKHTQGLGLVFIMDRLVKTQETGCLYVVFFDISSRKVLYSERLIEKAGGIGFRNFWFRPVKAAVDKLPKIYRNLPARK